uniref:(northern house mosquito) hypothetical protein n=1 Tax=Culex pipiens TaxID=7175 RepID=A0A8D8CVA6_CULPI
MNLEPSAWRRRTQSSKAVATSASASVWWYVTVCIALGVSLVESQGLQAIPPRLYVKNLSRNVNLLCKSDKPIEDCSLFAASRSLDTCNGRQRMTQVFPPGLDLTGTVGPRGNVASGLWS